MMDVAVLFARHDSIYKSLPGCDVWDIERDARTWPGGTPIVAHPPCRSWGTFRHVAKPVDGERELALWAVDQIRRYGGVLEHPARSALWREKPLPEPGQRDDWGGWTLVVSQWWWGHRAEKATRLYIVGCEPSELPSIPFRIGPASHVIAQCRLLPDGTRKRKGHPDWRPEVSAREREATPAAFASWLCQVARLCGRRH